MTLCHTSACKCAILEEGKEVSTKFTTFVSSIAADCEMATSCISEKMSMYYYGLLFKTLVTLRCLINAPPRLLIFRFFPTPPGTLLELPRLFPFFVNTIYTQFSRQNSVRLYIHFSFMLYNNLFCSLCRLILILSCFSNSDPTIIYVWISY